MNEIKQLSDIINSALTVALSDVHTICIASITAVNEKTINCKPVINRVVKDSDVELPEFVEVPPIFMKGGSSYTAHPIAVGDYCLILITERCFDKWWNGQDFQRPLEMRMHDYSDGFALVGINNLAGLISIPEVITQIGDTYQEGNYEHLGDMDHTGNLTHVGDVSHTGNGTQNGNSTQTGSFTLNGSATISGAVSAASFSATDFTSGGSAGVDAVFVASGKTVTVKKGIIISVV